MCSGSLTYPTRACVQGEQTITDMQIRLKGLQHDHKYDNTQHRARCPTAEPADLDLLKLVPVTPMLPDDALENREGEEEGPSSPLQLPLITQTQKSNYSAVCSGAADTQ